MKIIRLQSENVKRVKAVEITPRGSAVVIRGRNAQGKSSVLDSIAYALAGKKSHPKHVIREGAERAHVLLELDDLIVERIWESDDKSTLEVRSKEGKRYTSPQKLLDDLVGRLSFDPLAFMRQKPKEQVETLQELVGLDFSDLEEKHTLYFDQRKDFNREAKRIELNLPPADPAAPDEPIDVTALVEELEAVNKALAEIEQWHGTKSGIDLSISERRTRIEKLGEDLEHERKLLSEDERRMTIHMDESEWLPSEKPDPVPIREKIVAAEEHNKRHRLAEEWRTDREKFREAEKKAAELTQKLEDLEGNKRARIERAEMPVDELAFTDDGVTYQGLPLEQCAQSERLRVSIAMGFALNPKLRVLLIREASFFDEDQLQVVAKMAEEADAQVWLEVVGDEGPGVIIEDGEVAEVREAVRGEHQ